jgi:protein involved in polysaccharide export with SLBB domain
MLSAGYIRNPQVRVEVNQYKSQFVYVIGEVRAPGKITMTGTTMTLLEALALAGSPTSSASNEVIVVHPNRPNAGNAQPGTDVEGARITVNRKDLELGKAGQDIVLQDGDIINVPSAQHFYITGMVRNPGTFVLDPGMSIQQAIALAGGLNERADRRIKISRSVGGSSPESRWKTRSNPAIRSRLADGFRLQRPTQRSWNTQKIFCVLRAGAIVVTPCNARDGIQRPAGRRRVKSRRHSCEPSTRRAFVGASSTRGIRRPVDWPGPIVEVLPFHLPLRGLANTVPPRPAVLQTRPLALQIALASPVRSVSRGFGARLTFNPAIVHPTDRARLGPGAFISFATADPPWSGISRLPRPGG